MSKYVKYVGRISNSLLSINKIYKVKSEGNTFYKIEVDGKETFVNKKYFLQWEKPRKRGFEVVDDKHRTFKEQEIILPTRADRGSAGYDFRTPKLIVLEPNERKLVFTDVKAYMLEDEELELHIRSSIGVKKGVILSNATGIIDSSYYSNKETGGNIGLPLWNTSDKTVLIEAQERVAQGIFKKYLTIDDDKPLKENRTGGFGSSGTK